MNKTQKRYLIQEAGKYVQTLENELTPASAQNAYHALVKAYETGEKIDNLRKRYEAACVKVNDRFPS